MAAATALDLRATVSATYRAKDPLTAIQGRVQDERLIVALTARQRHLGQLRTI